MVDHDVRRAVVCMLAAIDLSALGCISGWYTAAAVASSIKDSRAAAIARMARAHEGQDGLCARRSTVRERRVIKRLKTYDASNDDAEIDADTGADTR